MTKTSFWFSLLGDLGPVPNNLPKQSDTSKVEETIFTKMDFYQNLILKELTGFEKWQFLLEKAIIMALYPTLQAINQLQI